MIVHNKHLSLNALNGFYDRMEALFKKVFDVVIDNDN
jgi:hypothetical protein